VTDFLDILLVIRACAEHYPPTVNQANLLVRQRLKVGVVDLSQQGIVPCLGPAIRRWRAHSAWDSKMEPRRSLFKRCANWFRFHQTCRNVIRSERPRVVLAYDILGIAVIPPENQVYQAIYHFHELPEREAGMGVATRWALAKAGHSARKAGLVVFSDKHRAEFYRQSARLPATPLVAMNCPLRLNVVPESPLQTELRELGLAARQVVCYVGSIGLDKGIGETVFSMKYWPENSLFVLIGPSAQSVKDRILSMAQTVGAADRVIFLGQKPHSEAMALAAGADLGVALIQPTTRNWLYSAGAINKRFEYMSLGVPQVTNDGPGVRDLVEKRGCGLCVDPHSPEAIGQAIGRLLGSRDKLRDMAECSRRSHLEEFYYEWQFEPVISWIKRSLSTRQPGYS